MVIQRDQDHAALQAAFRDLLLAHGYGALTIGAVASRANIGRSTFYEHYRTKDDLLRASLRQPFAALADLAGGAPDGARLEKLLLHVRDHPQLARVLLGWETRPVLATALAGLVEERLRTLAWAPPLIPMELAARQVAQAQLALLDAWIAFRPALTVEATLEALRASTAALVGALCPPAHAG
jgi:AcrR family transcriptional regulator